MTFTWTFENYCTAAQMYRTGLHSAREIGLAIGTTKMSVIGKMNRTGVVAVRTRADNQPPQPRPHVERKGPAKPVQAHQPVPAPVAVLAPVLRGVARAKPITALLQGECRWPVGETMTGHIFCGEPTFDDKQSYCPACRPLAYTATKPRIGQTPTAGRRFA